MAAHSGADGLLQVRREPAEKKKTMAMLKSSVSDGDHMQGSERSEVTLVEYGDYQCPYCGEAYATVKEIKRYFGDRLRFVFRNFPLSEIHPEAFPAAIVAEFAGTHGQFWLAHDVLFENQRSLGRPLYSEVFVMLDLPGSELQQRMRYENLKSRIVTDFRGGVRSGVNGTPTFFINRRRHEGPFSFEALAQAITVEVDCADARVEARDSHTSA